MTRAEDAPTVHERRLALSDGRTLAWVETGLPDGRPILRLPGTPGSRLFLRSDQTPWRERRLRVIVTERPGFGASTGHDGGTFLDHADDLAALLDELGIERLPILGLSGAAPYVLAFAARHRNRVEAATIVVGSAPKEGREASSLIGLNAQTHRLATAGDREGMSRLLTTVRDSLLADPLASFRELMKTAPQADQEIMRQRSWQEMLTRGLTEALRPGVQGWVDESMLLVEGWEELDLPAMRTSLTWWHGDQDLNEPLSAVRRLLDLLPPQPRLIVWPAAGHLTPYRKEAEILDELLARTQSSDTFRPRPIP